MKKTIGLIPLLLGLWVTYGAAQSRQDTLMVEALITREMGHYGDDEMLYLKNKLFGLNCAKAFSPRVHKRKKVQRMVKDLKRSSYNFSSIKVSNKTWKVLMEYGWAQQDYLFLEKLFVHLYHEPMNYPKFGTGRDVDRVFLDHQNYILYSFFAFIYERQHKWGKLHGMLAMLASKEVGLMRVHLQGHPDYKDIFAFMGLLSGRTCCCEDYKRRYVECGPDGRIHSVTNLVKEFRKALGPFCSQGTE